MARTPEHHAEIPRVTIEMGGRNIVVRATSAIDRACTEALARAVNAAADADTTVVIDPDPIRCDDAFASSLGSSTELLCMEHAGCRPVAVHMIACGMIRIAGEHSSWLVDVRDGRFCQTNGDVDVRFIEPAAWTPVVAVCLTRTTMSSLTTSGTLITARRAHRELAATA